MARTPDPQLKRELLDRVVVYLAEQGVAQTTLRPMAAELGVSINRLMHHFGSKDELITAALARAIDQQIDVQRKWLQRSPKLTQVELYRRWWKWLCATPENLALVRLNYEAATLEPTVTGSRRRRACRPDRRVATRRRATAGVGRFEAGAGRVAGIVDQGDLHRSGDGSLRNRRHAPADKALESWLARTRQGDVRPAASDARRRCRAHRTPRGSPHRLAVLADETRVVPARRHFEIPPCANHCDSGE